MSQNRRNIILLFFGLATALWMLFAARILAGILSSATLPTAMVYIGDSTSDEERGGGMVMLLGLVVSVVWLSREEPEAAPRTASV